MTKHVILGALASIMLASCGTQQIAKDVKMLSLKNPEEGKEVAYGNITGKSCQWSIMGYGLGEDPNMRTAFANAAQQIDGGAVPNLIKQKQEKPVLSVMRNVSTGREGMGLYVASRYCLTVEGLGYL